MSANTKIEWTDHTFNPWIGCQAISPGCTHCYAADWAKRYGRDFAERTRTKTWSAPLKWNAEHETFFAQHGRRQRVFCASLADVFDNAVPEQWRADLLALIQTTPNLDWQLLTKRIGNAKDMLDRAAWLICRDRTEPHEWQGLENVWIGATIINQEEADRDIPKLLAVPAAKRFLSMEPLLGAVSVFSKITGELLHESGVPYNPGWLNWIIVGGESGNKARPMHPAWAQNLRDQCAAAGVPFLFKQWGEWAPHCATAGGDEGSDLRRGHVRYLQGDGREPDGHFRKGDSAVAHVGKKTAGRQLDGITHDGFPE